jgi:TonB family protein
MDTFISYLIRSSVWLSAFGLVYFGFLRHERFFRLNRLFLITGLLSAILFPLITISYSVTIPQIQESVRVGEFSATAVNTIQTPLITWGNIGVGILLSGTLLFLVRMLIQTLMVIKTIRRSEVKIQNNLKVVKPNHFHYSFSFFSYIFVNPTAPEKEIREIVAHEAAHVRQYHWIDLVLAELLCAFQWFNPMAWLYSHFIRQNHEYLADQSALRSSPDPAFYKAILINHLLGSEVIRLGHSFSYSLNKKRFIMMKNTSTSIIRKLKLLAILPVIALIFYSFAKPRYEYENMTNKTVEVSTTLSTTSKEKKVEGAVTEANGSPLPGTSIIVSGSTNGAISDRNGHFSLNNVSQNDELVFSFVGFKTQSITPDFKNKMQVVMLRDTVKKDLGITIRSEKKEKDTNAEIQNNQKASKEPMRSISSGKIEENSPVSANTIKIEATQDASNNELGVTIRSGKNHKNNPLVFVDGKKVPYETLNSISPEDIEKIEVLKDESARKKYGDKATNGVVLITSKNADKTSQTENKEEELIFFIVEEMPKFPGGKSALYNYINKSTQYPPKAKEERIEGRVFVSFIISAKGKITDTKVVSGVHPLLNEEAKRVIASMPNWEPGKQRGKNVAVQYTTPVLFEL